MTAYVVIIRNKTTDPLGLEKYAALARQAPIDKLKVTASSKLGSRFQVLEGDPAEVVVILQFPTMDDALEWYNSDAYQKALPYRLAAADTRAILIEGVN